MSFKPLVYQIIWICALTGCFEAAAQRVIDRSEKKRPDWVGKIEKNHLIVSATADDLESAMQKSLASVKIQMLESVAQNIEYATETLIEQFTRNQEVESNITFRQQGKTNVANLPYLSGISLSKAEASYWELVSDNSTKEKTYIFYLLYPYSSSDYQALKNEFDRLDAHMVEVVKKHEEALLDIESVDAIGAALDELFLAYEYFFDKRRRSRTNNVIRSYQKIYANLSMESKRIARHAFQCRLTFNGNPMACSTLPALQAACASRLKCTTDSETYTVTFSDEDCIEDEPNYIELVFRWTPYTLKHKLYF